MAKIQSRKSSLGSDDSGAILPYRFIPPSSSGIVFGAPRREFQLLIAPRGGGDDTSRPTRAAIIPESGE